MAEEQAFVEIQITFGTAKAADKYCDSLHFQVGDEIEIGLSRFRLYTMCGAGFMKNTADGKIILTIDGWTQWTHVESDVIEKIIRYFQGLSKSKSEQIEIFIKGALFDKHYLATWKASDPNYFRTSSVSDYVYKGIKYTTDETTTDGPLNQDEQLLKKFLRQHTPYNKVRYWYLIKTKDMPYL